MRDMIRRCVVSALVVVLCTSTFVPASFLPQNYAEAVTTTDVAERSGDDGTTNWDFIEPVTHQTVVPEGYTGIYTAEDLDSVRNNLSGDYILMADIDLASFGEWTPIGDNQYPFNGFFNGNGYVVRNMTITAQLARSTHGGDGMGADVNYGLFGVALFQASLEGNKYDYSTVIANLGLEGTDIDVQYQGNGDLLSIGIGGVVGSCSYMPGSSGIYNCYNKGAIAFDSDDEDINVYAGGVAGGFVSVLSCYNTADISVSLSGSRQDRYNTLAGGVAGYVRSGIRECFNIGNVSLALDSTADNPTVVGHAGGLVGTSEGNIVNAYNAGSVEVVASAMDTEASTSWTDWGEFYAEARSFAAGIGFTYYQIISCYNSGDVASVATSNDTGHEGDRSWAAGISAYASAIIDSASMAHTVTSNINVYAIGNSQETTIENSYACLDINEEAQVDDVTRLLSRATFSNIDFWRDMLGWDFDAVWKMPEGGGYPIFYTQKDDSKGLQLLSFVLLPLDDDPIEAAIDHTHRKKASLTLGYNLWVLPYQATVTDGATYEIYTDKACANKYTPPQGISAGRLQLSPGTYTYYIKISAEGEDDVVYTLSIKVRTLEEEQNEQWASLQDPIPHIKFHANLANKTVYYDGSKKLSELFEHSSSQFSIDLAETSAALSAAAYNPHYLESDLEALGFEDVYVDDDYYTITGIYSTAHEIAHRKIIIDGQKCNLIAIVVRGTGGNPLETPLEWGNNITGAFGHVADNLIESFDNYMGKYENELSETAERNIIFMTGHSRGAATVNRAAAKFRDENKFAKSDVYTYTFASPNSEQKKFGIDMTNEKYNNIFNIVNSRDGITGWPSYLSNWKYGQTLALPSEEKTTGGYSWAYEGEYREKFKKSYAELVGVAPGAVDMEDFEDRGIGASTHNPEIYLAWLRVRPLELADEKAGSYKKKYIQIKCPVDVELYDENCALIGKTVNNLMDEATLSNDIIMYAIGDEKYVQLPIDSRQSIKLIGNGVGLMELTLADVDIVSGAVFSQKTFSNVALYDGKTMHIELAETSDAKLLVTEGGEVIGEIGEDGSESIPLQSLSLNITDVILVKGQSEQLAVTYNPAKTTVDRDITWTSSDTSIVVVTTSGKITAASEGVAIVTATAKSGISATCKVTVTAKGGIDLVDDTTLLPINLKVGESSGTIYDVSSTALPSTGDTRIHWRLLPILLIASGILMYLIPLGFKRRTRDGL
jgi:hypothetical protein